MNLNLIRVVNKAGAATCTAEDFQFFGRQITVTGFSLTENEGRTGEAVQELPIGGKIRIEGNGLKTANELYINGTSVDLTGIPAEEKERCLPDCDYSGNFAFRECCRESGQPE